MNCAYCNEPSEYVLHLKLVRTPEKGEDEVIEHREADVCMPCGSSVIALETKRTTFHSM